MAKITIIECDGCGEEIRTGPQSSARRFKVYSYNIGGATVSEKDREYDLCNLCAEKMNPKEWPRVVKKEKK